MTKSTSNSPPQGLNWTVLDVGAEGDSDNKETTGNKDESGEIKGLFDRNKGTSLTPLPVGENLSLPPVPDEAVNVKLVNIKGERQPDNEPSEIFPPPPVAAFGGKKEALLQQNSSAGEVAKESARGLFSMHGKGLSEIEHKKSDLGFREPVVPQTRAKSKKTVVGIGPARLQRPPTPSAAKQAEQEKEVVPPPPPPPQTPIARLVREEKISNELSEKRPQPFPESSPEGAVTAPPQAMASDKARATAAGAIPQPLEDTLFSGLSSVSSIPSESYSIPDTRKTRAREIPIELEPKPFAAQPTDSSAVSRKAPTRFRTAAWSLGIFILVLVGALAVVKTGVLRWPNDRVVVTQLPRQVKERDNKIKPEHPLESAAQSPADTTEINSPQSGQAAAEPRAQVVEEPVSTKSASIAKRNNKTTDEARSEDQTTGIEPAAKPESAVTGNSRDLLRRGSRQLANGNLDDAETLFRAVLNQEPDEHHAMEGLVKISLKRGKAKEALPLVQRIVEKRPKRAAYRVLYGDVLAMLGNTQAAKEQFGEALRFSPDNKEAKRRLAQYKLR
ncbi:MAG: tetratricopeptide repeat protein [Deltaproteobacteria bacterium]|nr:tetratricopeptide repeat protein [Deltaproteobacteria bacterium]